MRITRPQPSPSGAYYRGTPVRPGSLAGWLLRTTGWFLDVRHEVMCPDRDSRMSVSLSAVAGEFPARAQPRGAPSQRGGHTHDVWVQRKRAAGITLRWNEHHYGVFVARHYWRKEPIYMLGYDDPTLRERAQRGGRERQGRTRSHG
jgi:hypothetical protein